MNRIRLLPDQVANQIAAGEVVERPASVVKELVENAMDAGAQRIAVDIQGGGRQLVRVVDDGAGMSRDDALMCLERHATSKIRTAQDLAAITTMGFRGEALPSIASVSRFTLTTRERESASPEGTQVVLQGGKIVEVRSAGHAPGTTVEVRNLFFNLPARRKFLRSEETERAHILHYLTLAALAYPEVGFTLRQEDRLVWQLPPMAGGAGATAGVRERLRALLGAEVAMVAVEHTAPLVEGTPPEPDLEDAETGDARLSLRVWGFIGAPGVSRSSRQDQHLFVNRRPVENRGLNYALLEGYHTALMKGRYPVCCLFLEMAPTEVDVNVHPSKREVKFHREQTVRRIVAEAVRQALVGFHRAAQEPAVWPVRSTGAPGPLPAPGTPAFEPLRRPGSDTGAVLPAVAHAQMEWSVGGGPAPAGKPGFESKPPGAVPVAVDAAEPGDATFPASFPGMAPPAAATSQATPVVEAGRALLRVPLRLMGVLGNLYVLYESDRGLVLMDQHAAHERVLFEQVLERLERGEAPSQRLLLPETVELSVRDAQFLRGQLDVLGRLGVGLSEFGDRTFLLDALPPFVRVREARMFVVDLVEQLLAVGREVNSLRLGEEAVAKTVCRHAVKAHDPLTTAELVQLLEDLRRCHMPYTCPHGRPTLIEMSFHELERKFGRIQ